MTYPPSFPDPVKPEYFRARKLDITTALHHLAGGGHLAISSAPYLGRTSFIKKLTHPQTWQRYEDDFSSRIFIILDCLNIYPFVPCQLWRKVLESLQQELKRQNISLPALDSRLSKSEVESEDIKEICQQLAENNKKLVLILDNYNVTINGYPEDEIVKFVLNCRTLAMGEPGNNSQESQYLSMVVTSLRPLNEIGLQVFSTSPWFNHYQFISLKTFDDHEINDFINQIAVITGFDQTIGKIAGGHPALLQCAGSVLHTYQILNQVPTIEQFITKFFDRSKHIFEQTWNLCDLKEQTLLMLVALPNLQYRLDRNKFNLSRIESILSQQEKKLLDLVNWGIIYQDQQQSYKFTSELMEWWVIQEIKNTSPEKLEEQQAIFRELMGSTLTERVSDTLEYVWDHKEVVPDMLNYIGRVMGSIPKGITKGIFKNIIS